MTEPIWDIESRALRAAREAEESTLRAALAPGLAEKLVLSVDEALVAAADRFALATRDLAREAVAWERKRCPGVEPRGPLAAHDLLRIARAPGHDGRLGTERARTVTVATLSAMGLGASLLPAPAGRGLPAWRETLRTAGTSIGLPLGPLFERLLTEPLWLARSAEIAHPEVEPTIRSAATAMLLDARRTAALVSWSAALRASIADPAASFRDRMTEAMDADWPAGGWAAEIDLGDGPRLVREMREPAARRALVDGFDEDWFRNPRAGAFLRTLAAELDPAPDPEPLVGRFEALLG